MPRSEPAAVEDPHRRRAVEEDPRYHRAVEVPHLGGGGFALLPHCGGPALWRRRTRIASTPWRRRTRAVEEQEPATVAPRHRRGSEGRRDAGRQALGELQQQLVVGELQQQRPFETLPALCCFLEREREERGNKRDQKRYLLCRERERRETRGAALRRHEIFCPVPRLLNFSRVTPKFSVLRFIFCAGRLKRPTPKIIFFVLVA
jgi:hypothetical protein